MREMLGWKPLECQHPWNVGFYDLKQQDASPRGFEKFKLLNGILGVGRS